MVANCNQGEIYKIKIPVNNLTYPKVKSTRSAYHFIISIMLALCVSWELGGKSSSEALGPTGYIAIYHLMTSQNFNKMEVMWDKKNINNHRHKELMMESLPDAQFPFAALLWQKIG